MKSKKRKDTLEQQIENIKKRINKIGYLRSGSLSEQYNVCGSPGCKCKATPPQKHGPYNQLSFTKNGRSSTKFINRKIIKNIKSEVNNHAQLKKLVAKWVELGTELSELKLSELKIDKKR